MFSSVVLGTMARAIHWNYWRNYLSKSIENFHRCRSMMNRMEMATSEVRMMVAECKHCLGPMKRNLSAVEQDRVVGVELMSMAKRMLMEEDTH